MKEVFQKIGKVLAMTETSTQTWKIGNGIRVFPEGLCPFCQKSIRSTAIWKIGNGILHGRWEFLEGKGHFKAPQANFGFHPHVGENAAICLGNNGSPDAALFFGMNPAGAYPGWTDEVGAIPRWEEFLKNIWGHECSEDLIEHLPNSEADCEFCEHGNTFCGDEASDGCLCTRPQGHEGEHVSCDDSHEGHTWGQDMPF